MRNYQLKINTGGVPDSIATNKLGAGEVNSYLDELENSVSRTGQTLAPADGSGEISIQLGRAMFISGTAAQSFIDSGAADAYVATPITGASGLIVPSAYVQMDGIVISFLATNTNAGASTLNIGQTAGTLLGAKSIRYFDGSALTGGEITSGERINLIFDEGNDYWVFFTENFAKDDKVVHLAGLENISGIKIFLSGVNFGGDDAITFTEVDNFYHFGADGGTDSGNILCNNLLINGALQFGSDDSIAFDDPTNTYDFIADALVANSRINIGAMSLAASTYLTSVSTGAGDNDKLPTQGYVDDNFVDLTSTQSIPGIKTFLSGVNFGGDDAITFTEVDNFYHFGADGGTDSGNILCNNLRANGALQFGSNDSIAFDDPTNTYDFIADTLVANSRINIGAMSLAASTYLTSVSTGVGDNDKAVTQGYVDDKVSPLIFHIQDQKAQNTDGGTFTLGAWRTRDLNTALTNEIIGASLGSNQITLPAGTYRIESYAMASNVDSNQARLQNITDVATTLIGSSSSVGSGDNGFAFVKGQFTIAATKTFELQHICQSTGTTTGFGNAANFTTEVYSDVQILKVA